MMASRTTNGPAGDNTDISRALAAEIQSPPSSLPVEMSSLGHHAKADSTFTDSSPSTLAISPGFLRSSRDGEGHDVSSATTDSEQAPHLHGPIARPPPITLQATPSAFLTPLRQEKTAPAIGPSSDTPIPLPKHSDTTGPQLMITLLLINGARHPYKIDDKYLKKRSVSVEDNNPINLSTYTLKELIWREWREDWEVRPSSPSSIRLIYYGKLLDDKMRLQDCKFVLGTTPHVVHMTVKPQEIVDVEDAKMAKSGDRDRDGNEGRSGLCGRCVIL